MMELRREKGWRREDDRKGEPVALLDCAALDGWTDSGRCRPNNDMLFGLTFAMRSTRLAE